ncbi:MAG: hypothetical protein ACREXR_01685 [Gammaproteobacteria bacterium]
MKITPKFDRVLIRRDTIQDSLRARQSSILLPPGAVQANPSERGTVLAVGAGAGLRDKDGVLLESITVGSRVIFAIHSGVIVKTGNENEESLFLCQDNDILAEIIEE